MTVLLGVDPGSRRMGWGAIAVEGSTLLHRGHGTLVVPERAPLPDRLARLHAALCEVFDAQRPAEIALEQVFIARNVRSALTLGQVRGIVILEAGRRRIELAEYAPAAVKIAVTGSGRASKDQVAQMVQRLLGTGIDDLGPDASDALALAICHAHGRQRRKLIARARDGRA